MNRPAPLSTAALPILIAACGERAAWSESLGSRVRSSPQLGDVAEIGQRLRVGEGIGVLLALVNEPGVR